jgi:transposase
MVWKLPKGANFLPDITTDKLQNMYAAEQHAKSKLRLLAAIHRRQGTSIDDIADMISKSKRTVHGWLTRFAERGIEGKDARKQSGRPRRLTLAQRQQLIKELERGPPHNISGLWSTKDVQDLLRRKYDVVFVKQHVWRILDQLGFSMQRPRKKHYKSPTPEAVALFKKKRVDWCMSTRNAGL